MRNGSSTSTLVRNEQGLTFPNPTYEESKQDGTNLYESLDDVYAKQNADKEESKQDGTNLYETLDNVYVNQNADKDEDYEDIEANCSPNVNKISMRDSSVFEQIDQYETQGFEIQLSDLYEDIKA